MLTQTEDLAAGQSMLNSLLQLRQIDFGSDSDIVYPSAIRMQDGQPFFLKCIAQRLPVCLRRYTQTQPHLAAPAEQGDAGRVWTATRERLEHGQKGPSQREVRSLILIEKANNAAHKHFLLEFRDRSDYTQSIPLSQLFIREPTAPAGRGGREWIEAR